MIELKTGDVLTGIKRGVSAKGDWGFAKATSDNGKDAITVWFSNISDLSEDVYAVEVENIKSVKLSAHEYPKGSGKWYKDVAIAAQVKAVSGSNSTNDIPSGFEALTGEDIPF